MSRNHYSRMLLKSCVTRQFKKMQVTWRLVGQSEAIHKRACGKCECISGQRSDGQRPRILLTSAKTVGIGNSQALRNPFHIYQRYIPDATLHAAVAGPVQSRVAALRSPEPMFVERVGERGEEKCFRREAQITTCDVLDSPAVAGVRRPVHRSLRSCCTAPVTGGRCSRRPSGAG